MRYAGVVVEVPARKIDRPFDYKIPQRYIGKITIGSHVLVPFGRRNIEGFVVELKDKTEYQEIKEIYELLHDFPLFDKKMLDLMTWISDYYQALLINVIKTVIPTGVIRNKVSVKTQKYISLNVKPEKAQEWVEKYSARAPKQVEIIKYLLNHPNEFIPAADLVKKVNTGYKGIEGLVKKGLIIYKDQVIDRRPYNAEDFQRSSPLKPNFYQYQAINTITDLLQKGQADTVLLKGVTGSGKTEVYLQVIAKAMELGKDTIVLIPEIALTPQTVERFKSRFGENVAVWHSQLSLGERFDEWRRIYEGKVRIVVGARSAIFAPFKNLGLIVIDEEHETSYKQSDQVKYHAKDVAIKRGELCGAVTVLGSATPSIESMYKALTNDYHLINLPRRVNMAPLPPVEIVDMRYELKQGNKTIFSRKLHQAIKDRLKEKKQVILFINRRGYSNFVLCRECGYVIRCKNCDVSLTYHANTDYLHCHYCDYRADVPKICKNCGSKLIKHFGIGTQQVEEFTRKCFPTARIVRMDIDTTRYKGAHDKILRAFRNKEIDILIGTQMISKGHDFPDVTLVGVVIADTALHFPDFRSGERTFQLLTQVAGRTGRGSEKGEVIIQTYSPEHYSIKAVKNHDYDLFFHEEIRYRREMLHPPFSQLINIIISDESESLVIKEAHLLVNLLANQISEDYPIEVLGPAPAPLSKIKNKYRWQILLKSRVENGIFMRKTCQEVMESYYKKQNSSITVTVDVDPISML